MNLTSKVKEGLHSVLHLGFILFAQMLNSWPNVWPTCSQFFFNRQIFQICCGISNSLFINSTISRETPKMFYGNLVGKHWVWTVGSSVWK